MRLLHTFSLAFSDFYDPDIPSYCILSHRWGRDEADYASMRDGTYNLHSRGMRKITGTCNLAKSLGYSWIWIDTICINKSDLTELTEAINSMYRWYAASSFCIALLDDVAAPEPGSPSTVDSHQSQRRPLRSDYDNTVKRSQWFTRGWTLQELLAPRHLGFYDRDFGLIGSKSDLSDVVSDITRIGRSYLIGKRDIRDASVAIRMSWASERQTTRPEDMAHSLFGILGIPSMPLLYGDGAEAAFRRLQLELLKVSNDETIFAWLPLGDRCESEEQPFGILADSPGDFAYSGHIESTPSSDLTPYVYTHRGLQLERPYVSIRDKSRREFWQETNIDPKRAILKLACRVIPSKNGTVSPNSSSDREVLAVALRQIDGSWYRVKCTDHIFISARLREEPSQRFYLPQTSDLRRRSIPADNSSWIPYGITQHGDSYHRSRRKRARDNWNFGALVGVVSEFLV